MEPPHVQSRLMGRLNDLAIKKSRARITAKFKQPIDLNDIATERHELQRQLELAESQLNVAVQNKLDALKKAAEIMEESSSKLTELAVVFKSVDEDIAETNSDIANYEHLSRVHFARDNIATVIARVELFAKVPKKVKALNKSMKADPDKLKDVFLEAVKLQALRDGLLKEIKISKHRRKSVWNNSPGKGSGKRSKRGGDYSSEAHKKVREAVEDHLYLVPALMAKIHKRLLANVERFIELGIENPSELVMTFEIIEMHQEFMERQLRQAQAQAEADGRDADDIDTEGYEDLSRKVQDRLRTIITEKVDSSFAIARKILKKGAKGKESGPGQPELSATESVLSMANQLLLLMGDFEHEVVPCIPPWYDPLDMFIDAFEDSFLPELEKIMSEDDVEGSRSNMQVSDLLQIIDWIEQYCNFLITSHREDRKSIQVLKNLANEALQEYLFRIKDQLKLWFGRITAQATEIRRGNDGRPFTTQPEDMFAALYSQVSVARERNLPAVHIKDVVNVCLQVLRDMQRQAYDHLESEWRNMDVDIICALVNDNERLQDKCDEFRDSVLGQVTQSDQKEFYTTMLEEVSSEYVTLAVHSLEYLAKGVMSDFEDTVYSKLFSIAWERGESLMPTVTATILEYFQLVSSSLAQYYYSKFAKRLFEMVVGTYLMTLRRVADGSFHFINELAVAGKILNDRRVLEEFFEGYSELLRTGGLKPLITMPVLNNPQQQQAQSKSAAANTNTNATKKPAVGPKGPPPKKPPATGTPSKSPANVKGVPSAFHKYAVSAVGKAPADKSSAAAAALKSKGNALILAPISLERTLVASHLEPFKYLATVISATHIGGAIADIKQLYWTFKGDGFKLVCAAIMSSPALSKAEKTQNIDKITSLFEVGVAQGTYSRELSEVYKHYDAVDDISGAAGSTMRGPNKNGNDPKKKSFFGFR